MSTPIWTLDAMAQAMGAQLHGALPTASIGLSIDTRTMGLREAFFAFTQ